MGLQEATRRPWSSMLSKLLAEVQPASTDEVTQRGSTVFVRCLPQFANTQADQASMTLGFKTRKGRQEL